jgi:hypothetical protein
MPIKIVVDRLSQLVGLRYDETSLRLWTNECKFTTILRLIYFNRSLSLGNGNLGLESRHFTHFMLFPVGGAAIFSIFPVAGTVSCHNPDTVGVEHILLSLAAYYFKMKLLQHPGDKAGVEENTQKITVVVCSVAVWMAFRVKVLTGGFLRLFCTKSLLIFQCDAEALKAFVSANFAMRIFC